MTDLDPLESLYFAALERAPADRSAYLDEACRGKPELRERVERLLAAKPQIGEFLQPPAVTVTFAGEHEQATIDFPGRDERIGAMLAGKYKLIEAIGEGGMGSVYMAQQTQPVKRNVAVKVIKAGMDSKAVLARFEAERQALAMMDHPNIARVLDAGTTESGRPFFVMELVKGVPITEYCDARKLTPRQRLELFVPVCNAIQHAHQKGIIHRDIKPSNVLVALYDDKPVPKVIDFGLAKAAGQTLTDKTLMTGFGAVVGTPEYMSPEQASLNNLDIDTRSDVYSLGVLLYELLTGSTPVDRKSLGKAALMEILRIVREVEAPKPSAKLSTIDTLPSVAANRGSEPAKLSKMMRGELDWVVLKALEKDRERRYDTANGFARDIERFLNHEAVQAGPVTNAYRLRKFVQRNRGRVVAAGLVAAVMAVGVVGTTLGFVRATAQRDRALIAEEEARAASRQAAISEDDSRAQKDRAVAARARADDEATAAKAVNDFLLKDLLAPASQGAFALGAKAEPNPDVTIRELMERAESRVAERFGDRPLIEASVREVIAQSYLQQERKDYRGAIANLERVAELMAIHFGPLHHKTLDARFNVASWTAEAGRASEPLKQRGFRLLDGFRDTLSTLPDPLSGDTASTAYSLAVKYVYSGLPKEAVPLFERCLVADPTEISRTDRTWLSRVRLDLAEAHRATGATGEADREIERVRADFAATLAGGVEPAQHRMLLILADQLNKLGKPVSVESLYRSARANAERLDTADDRDALAAWCAFADAMERDNRIAEAIRAYERGRDRLEHRAKGGASSAPAWVHRQGLYQSLGELYLKAGRKDEAFAAFTKFLETCRERGLNTDFGTTQLTIVALGFRRAGRHAEAIPVLREAIELNRKASGPESSWAAPLEMQMGATWMEAGRPRESIEVLDGLIGRLKPDGKSRDILRYAFQNRAKAREALSQFGPAADDWNEAHALCPENSADRWDAMTFRASDRARAGRVEEALRDADELAANDANYVNGFYNAACICSLAFTAAPRPPIRGGDDTAGKAVQYLRRAVAAGKTTLAAIAADPDFDPIRDRKDYLLLIAELQAKQLEIARKRSPSEGPPLGDEIAIYCSTLLKTGAFAEAEPLLRECLTIREKTQPDDWRTSNTRSLLGGSLLGQKKYAEAEPLLLKGYEGMKAREKLIPPQGSTRIPEAIDRLVDLYAQTNKPDEAKKWRSERAKYNEHAPMPRVVK